MAYLNVTVQLSRRKCCKKRAYEQRVREIEHASFTPLVLSESGGLAKEAKNFYKRLDSKLGPFLQPDHELIAIHVVICSTPLRNSVRSGCSLHSWPRRQGLLFACGFGISRGQHSTLLVTVFLVLILLPFSFPVILYSNHIFL